MKINNIQFYKPNAANKGVAVSVALNPKDAGIYFSFIKQHSWDNVKKIGSFKGNKENPKAKKNIKINDIEAAGIIRAIEKEEKWTAYHKFNESSGVSISFAPYIKENIMSGFGLRIVDSKDKENIFSVGFTNDESIKLREWLKAGLNEIFKSENIAQENAE